MDSMHNKALPISGCMLITLKLVGLEKAVMNSWYLISSEETNSTAMERCKVDESVSRNIPANLS